MTAAIKEAIKQAEADREQLLAQLAEEEQVRLRIDQLRVFIQMGRSILGEKKP